jgi:hypothetical protein
MGDYLIFCSHTPISWKSKKKRTVARSSTETKYKALVDDTYKVIWLQYLLQDLQITPSLVLMTWCNNLDATYLSVKPIFHARTKYIEVDYHFVHDRVATKAI